jgi:DNA invertase Pin-like site-specific DNA recombinase
MFIRAYLRASTDQQDAARAREDLESFVAERGLMIAASYTENESGASLKRPELFRLLNDCQPGDVLLVEQVDRLSRLNGTDWERLKQEIAAQQVRIVALDLPSSHAMATAKQDDFTGRMLEAVNAMLLDMLAAVARKDYEDRRRRTAQGIAMAKAEGRFKGRPEDKERNARIGQLLENGMSWNEVINLAGCSRATVSRIAARRKAEVATAPA